MSASAHDFRPAFGVLWAARLMPAQMMEMMRHESIETTLRFSVGTDAQRTAEAAWAAFEPHRKTPLGGAPNRSSSSTPDGGVTVTPAEERASLKNRDARE